MTPTEMKILLTLDQFTNAMSARALATATGAGYSSITASLRRLKAAGEIDMTKQGAKRRTKTATTKKPKKPKGIAAGVLRVLRPLKAGVGMTAYAISQRLHKSPGAVANACERLFMQGALHIIKRTPRTYEVL